MPPGFPGAGSMKIVSFGGGGWYHCYFTPDGNGTFDITSASLRANIPVGPEGIAFASPGSPVFPANSVLIVADPYGKVVTAPLDTNGDPIVAQSQDFIRGLTQPEAACTDPVTGDFLFAPWGGTAQVLRVSGFATPPTPTPTPTSVVHSRAMGFRGCLSVQLFYRSACDRWHFCLCLRRTYVAPESTTQRLTATTRSPTLGLPSTSMATAPDCRLPR